MSLSSGSEGGKSESEVEESMLRWRLHGVEGFEPGSGPGPGPAPV